MELCSFESYFILANLLSGLVHKVPFTTISLKKEDRIEYNLRHVCSQADYYHCCKRVADLEANVWVWAETREEHQMVHH